MVVHVQGQPTWTPYKTAQPQSHTTTPSATWVNSDCPDVKPNPDELQEASFGFPMDPEQKKATLVSLKQKETQKSEKTCFKCPVCGIGFFTPKDLDTHTRIHNEFHQCPDCSFKSKSKPGLKQHRVKMHNPMELQFACNYCESRFKVKNDLMLHLDKAHARSHERRQYKGRRAAINRQEASTEVSDASKTKQDPVLGTLKKEIKLEISDEETTLKNEAKSCKQFFKCTRCRSSFTMQKDFHDHKKTHEPQYLECLICNLSYRTKFNLYQHYAQAHGNCDSKFVCDYCGKTYELKKDLKRHIKQHMNSIQTCKQCGKEVKDLKRHEALHQREDPPTSRFFCRPCLRGFNTRKGLRKHRLRHKEGFECETCSERFQVYRELVRHKKSNHYNYPKRKPVPITCPLCKQLFPFRSSFYPHVLKHAGIKAYKCDLCDESFNKRKSMLQHRKSHAPPLPPPPPPVSIAELARKALSKF